MKKSKKISKRKLSLLQINKNIQLYIKSTLSQQKCQLIGGGGCCSKQDLTGFNFNQINEIDKPSINNHQNMEFENEYKKWTNSETISKSIENNKQLNVQKFLVQQCIIDQIIDFDYQIKTYSSEIQCIFENYLILEVTRVICKSNSEQEQFQKILEDLKCFEYYEEDFPIMELVFYIKILVDLNKLNYKFDESEKKEILNIKEFVNLILNFNKNQNFTDITSKTNQIKSNIQLFNKKKELFALKYQVEIWLRKIEQFGDKFMLISPLEEILFYVEFFFEINKKQNQQDFIILTLIKINFILEQFQKQKFQVNDKTQINQQFSNSLIKANIELFLNELMQKQDKFINNLFLIFSVENKNYRYITLSILLTINSILTNEFSNIQNYQYQIDFLCNKYLTEKQLEIRVIFEKSDEFAKYFNLNIKIDSFKQNMITFDKQRKEKLQPLVKSLENYERSINSFDDIIKLISDNAIQKWERDIQKRQRQNISQKDDVLLEVRDLYINQMITYLHGNPILQRSVQNNNKDKENENLISEQQNALSDILKLFLTSDNSNKVKNINNKSEQNDNGEDDDGNQFKMRQNECQILGILAEGGSGKSMLMKKLETLLIENLTKQKAVTEKVTENYLPILVKCNSLDSKKPSLEEYLEKQGINESMLQNLKQNDKYKLILLDGYDEYTGDYFEVYSTLKIKEWKNTKIIVATRKEKLSEKDASIYFSKQNELGQIDEMSYTLVQLEEFTLKDIYEYAERYFKQERKTEQVKQIEKDLTNLRECLTNAELEKILHLPINLYLFTRMLVNINEKLIENLKVKVNDQIGIQEIFFSDQFEREAQSFIDGHIDSIDLKKDKSFRTSIKNNYFEYFQAIAMKMFKNRGIQSNYLQVDRQNINFNLSKSVTLVLMQKSLENSLENKIKNYINSKIITRVKSEQQQNINVFDDKQKQFIEFKHKSLFEYFVAKAMKNDFDIHEENIFQLKLEELEQFQINKKCIMNIGSNQSEQQILIKFYKLIKNQVESQEFYSSYHYNQIEKNNRYIQYLKRSQIQTASDTSQIDIGASNLISALFISNFSYSKLNLTLCSFSKAYLCNSKSNEINLYKCNFQNAFLYNTNINLDSCNTKSAYFDVYRKVFDSNNKYSFNQVLWGKDGSLFCISEQGFINAYKIMDQGFQEIMSIQLSQTSLINILLFDDDHFLISSKQTLFLINQNNLDIKQIHKFTQSISSITMIEKTILVILESKHILKGSFDEGFQQLNIMGSGSIYIKSGQILLTYEDYQFSLWSLNNDFELIDTYQEHTDIINSVAFSEIGKYLATGSSDKTCKIWNVENGFELISTIEGHTEPIQFVAFSEDGKYLVTSSNDKTCKIWNAEKNFELVKTIPINLNASYSVAFSEDGKYLSTYSDDKFCFIWDIEKNFQATYIICAHYQTVWSVAFSSDGKYLATGSEDGSCKIWLNSDSRFSLIKSLEQHDDKKVFSVAFSSDGKFLATGSQDCTCKIWNVEKDFELINTINIDTLILSVAFSANGKYLATGQYDNLCKIWNVEKNFEPIKTIQGHTDYVRSVAFSADGKYLATGSEDNTCKIWSVGKGFEISKIIEDHSEAVKSVAFSEDGKYLATGSDDNTCRIWNAQKDFEPIHTIEDHKFKCLTFSVDGKYLATGSIDQTCKIWSIEKGFELINTIKCHTKYLTTVAFSVDGKYLATGSADNTFKIWNTEIGFEIINTVQGHLDVIGDVAFSSDGQYLATCSQDGSCKIWNAEKCFELIKTIKGHKNIIRLIIFSSDGKYLVSVSDDLTFKIWNSKKDFELINTIQGHTETIYSVAFSADGRYLVTSSMDVSCKIWNAEKDFELVNTIDEENFTFSIAFSANGKYLVTNAVASQYDYFCKIWNPEKGFELINKICCHEQLVYSIAFSADGKYFATGSLDKTCKIWNVEKGFELIYTIQGHHQSVQYVTFTADGKYLATSSKDRTCKIWNIEKDFKLTNTIQSSKNYIDKVVFSANNKYLVTNSLDKTCKIWDAEKGFELIKTIQDKANIISNSVDGKYLAVVIDNNICKIWNVENGFELINTIQGHTQPINYVAFSADGNFLLTCSQDNTCKIWNGQKNFQLYYTFNELTSTLTSVSISANCQYLGTINADKICNIWQFNSNYSKVEQKLRVEQVCKIEFSRNNKFILLQLIGDVYKIYDLQTQEIVKENDISQENLEKIKKKYSFEQIKNIECEKMQLFENVYVL